MRYFAAIVRHGSFTRAADALYLSQPALSKAIRELEAEMDLPLFDRQQHPVTLTDAGRLLYGFVEDWEGRVHQLGRALEELKDGQLGEVSVGLPPIMSSTVLADVLIHFRQQYPRIRLSIEEVGGIEVVQRVRQGSLDLGFTVLPSEYEDLEAISLWNEPVDMVVESHHPWSLKPTLAWRELDGARVLLYRPDFSLHEKIWAEFARFGAVPNVVQTSSEWEFLILMAAAGLGITFIPRSLAHRRVQGGISIVSMAPPIEWNLGLVRSRRRTASRAMDLVWRIAEEHRWTTE